MHAVDKATDVACVIGKFLKKLANLQRSNEKCDVNVTLCNNQ